MFQILLPGHSSDQDKIGQSIQLQVAPYIQLNTIDVHDDIIEKRTIENLWSSTPVTKENRMDFGFDTSNLVAIKIDGLTDLF